MKLLRTLPTSLAFTALLGALFGFGLTLGHAAADDAKPCVAATLPKVKAACGKGGQAEAKKLMKAVVDKAKAAGKEIKCLSCHVDLKAFALTPNAMADLKPLL